MAALAYVTKDGRGASDRLLAEVAARLDARGWPLAGVVQHNIPLGDTDLCDMHLRILRSDRKVCISQSLGAGSTGCRLNPQGLAEAVGLVAPLLGDARLLIVNKFGKAESEGDGFRDLIGQALGQGIPVLTAVNGLNRAAFELFAGGMAEALPADLAAILGWCDTAVTATI